MSKKERRAVVDMRWLAEGREDDFVRYLERCREDLPMADWSDDELANYAFMHYNRDMNTEVAVMMNPEGEHYPKIAFMTATKERIRWLSRQLAVAEGRYPGVDIPNDIILKVREQETEAGREHVRITKALFEALDLGCWDDWHGSRLAFLTRLQKRLKEYAVPEEMFGKAFNYGVVEYKGTNTASLVSLRELVVFVEAAAGFKVKPQPYKLTSAIGDGDHSVRVTGDTEMPVNNGEIPESAQQFADAQWEAELKGLYHGLGINPEGTDIGAIVALIQDAADIPEADALIAIGQNPSVTGLKRIQVFYEVCKQLVVKGVKIPYTGQRHAFDVSSDIFSRPTDMSEGSVIAEHELRLVPGVVQPKVKREYNPKDFATNQGDIAWSTLGMTRDCPPGYVTKAPQPKQCDTYLGTHVEARLHGAVLHGFVDKHGLKVTYFCNKQGELREILRWAGDDLTRKYYEFTDRKPPAGVASQMQEGDRYIRLLSKHEAPTSGCSYYAEEGCTGRLVIYHFTERGNLVSRHQLDRFYIAAEHPEEGQPIRYSVERLGTDEDERWASERWSTEIHGLYAVFGGRTHEMSRDAIVDKIFGVIALTPKFNMELVNGALGFNQELNMIERLSLFHVLVGHLTRAGYYVPVNGDTILVPDDSGFSLIVSSRVYLAGQAIQIRPGVHLNLVKQVTKQG